MYNAPEQFLAAQRALLDTTHHVGLRAIEGASKLFELNAEVARATLNRTAEQLRTALSADAARPVEANPAALVQPALERVAAYSKRAYGIVSSTNDDIVSLLQRHAAGVQQAAVSTVEGTTEQAAAAVVPAVADTGNAAKQSIDTAQAAFEQVTAAATAATKTEGRASRKSAAPAAE